MPPKEPERREAMSGGFFPQEEFLEFYSDFEEFAQWAALQGFDLSPEELDKLRAFPLPFARAVWAAAADRPPGQAAAPRPKTRDHKRGLNHLHGQAVHRPPASATGRPPLTRWTGVGHTQQPQPEKTKTVERHTPK